MKIFKKLVGVISAFTSIFVMACSNSGPKVYGPAPVHRDLPESSDEISEIYGPPEMLEEYNARENNVGAENSETDNSLEDIKAGNNSDPEVIDPEPLPQSEDVFNEIYGPPEMLEQNNK